jgi:hypothetical protein
MTLIFLDSEFTGGHRGTTLISIGLISEDGRTFYAELLDYDTEQINDWLKENVIPNLQGNRFIPSEDLRNYRVLGDRAMVGSHLNTWLSQFDQVEIWSDVYHFDWVLFSDLFGNDFSLPENVSYIPFDIATFFKVKGIDPDISREGFVGVEDTELKHNALWDAKIIKMCYEKLIKL